MKKRQCSDLKIWKGFGFEKSVELYGLGTGCLGGAEKKRKEIILKKLCNHHQTNNYRSNR